MDVGANIGHYTYRLSKLFKKVIAFEINPDLLDKLAAYRGGHIQIVPFGLSSRSGEAVLFIPHVRGRTLTGWASLQHDNLLQANSYTEKRTRVVELDSFALQHVSFIKIDVEGHELEVLVGARETIARWLPILLVEVKAPNVAAVEAFLLPYGYVRRSLDDFAPVPGSSDNLIFVPHRRLPGEL